MKRFFKYLAAHQVAALSASLTVMFSVSIVALLDSFNHMV